MKIENLIQDQVIIRNFKRNRKTKFSDTNPSVFKKECYCPICKKIFNRKYDFQRHYRIHEDNKPYKCKVCGVSYTRSDYLKKHIRKSDHHNNCTI